MKRNLLLLFLCLLLPLLAACSAEPVELILSPLEEQTPVPAQNGDWNLRITTPYGPAVPAVITTPQATPDTDPPVQPEDPSDAPAYILNTNTKRFHLPSCPSVKDMKPANRESFSGSRDELLERGYKACGRCRP